MNFYFRSYFLIRFQTPSDPHPFISILMPVKGKKVLPRITRHLNPNKMIQLSTYLVACFSQLDVVKLAPLLDSLDDSPERKEAERQTQAFLGSVLQSIIPVVAKASLRIVTGLLSLLISRSDIVAVTQTRVCTLSIYICRTYSKVFKLQPGLALLTLFLSRVEVIKQNINNASEASDIPSADAALQW